MVYCAGKLTENLKLFYKSIRPNLWHGAVLFTVPLTFELFIGLHLRQSDWKSPTVIMYPASRGPSIFLDKSAGRSKSRVVIMWTGI